MKFWGHVRNQWVCCQWQILRTDWSSRQRWMEGLHLSNRSEAGRIYETDVNADSSDRGTWHVVVADVEWWHGVTEDLQFIGLNVWVRGGLLDDVIPLYCNPCNETMIDRIYSALIIVWAHSFIMKGVKGTELPIMASVYVHPPSWSFACFFSSSNLKQASSSSIFEYPRYREKSDQI